MLTLLFSRAGGGKTTAVLERLSAAAAAGEDRLTLLVPEQFSFTSQKQMLARLSARAAARIDILSFTALAEQLIGEAALQQCRRLDEAAETAMMATALANVRDRLQLYGQHASRRSVIREFTALRSECKCSAVSAEDLRAASGAVATPLLRAKLQDLATVFDAYDALLGSSCFDPDDLLTVCADCMDSRDYFRDRTVMIDGFRGFTAQELRVIGGMLRQAREVCVTLCCDGLRNLGDETDLFAHTKRTASALIRLAKQNGVPAALPTVLGGDARRGVAPALAALERNLYAAAPEVYDAPCEELLLCKAADIDSECAFVAATAKKLIRTEGLRCREIAIIARNIDDYEAPLHSALRKCGIGAFADVRRPVAASPVVNLVESAVEIAAKGFDTERVMRYLKTELTGLTTEEIAALEDYSYLWQLRGGAWTKPWTRNPRGFGAMTEEDAAALETLEALRVRTVQPLLSLRRSLHEGDGSACAAAVWQLLVRTDAATHLRTLADALIAQGEPGAAMELDRLWTVVVALLDSLETLLRGRTVTPEEFFETFSLMLDAQTVGSLPQGLDEITVGAADRIRTAAPKAVFIVGCNSGVFPAVPASGAALTDHDRRALAALGVELAGFGEYQLAEERLIAYSACSCATQRLFVSCPERGANGDTLAPSEIYLKIKRLFSQVREVDAAQAEPLYYAEGAAPAFEQLARQRAHGNTAYASFLEYFSADPVYAGRLAALDRACGGRDYRIEDPAAARALFGDRMQISASRVERYHQCPFAYFCSYGLRANPRRPAELDPMQRGSIIHAVLEALLRSHRGEALTALTRPALEAFVHAEMAAHLTEMFGEESPGERFLYLYAQLEGAVCDVAERLIEELRNSDFEPVAFELRIGGAEPEIPAYTLRDGDGGLSISGAVDRVDTAVINGKTYLRVVDYKSSGKPFRLSDAMHGLNLQMLIYLFALWRNGTDRFGDVTPAGVLYYPAKAPRVSLPRDASAEDVALAARKQCRTEGLVLRDCDVVLAMDRTAGGLYIPVDFKKGEMRGSLIGLRQLEALKLRADTILLEMVHALHAGEIPALPAEGRNYQHVCQYCDYQSVCGYETDIPVRKLADADHDAVLTALDGEEGAADGVDA
ncbi:MAG: PD-(D/E)XK nuclease family protein [Clostridia bacterium]|nr:PD-(D/E)XK nuclease family protein [Clostridia bacterium]